MKVRGLYGGREMGRGDALRLLAQNYRRKIHMTHKERGSTALLKCTAFSHSLL